MNIDIEDTVRAVRRTLVESGEAMRLGVQCIQELETALNRLVLTVENTLADTDGQWPHADAGCIYCTAGTVPDKLNTGPCALHNAKALLGQL